MVRQRPKNYFTKLDSIPVHYDRLPSPYNYGTRGKSLRFYARLTFEQKLDACFSELFSLCPYGPAEIITSAGTFADKAFYHGKGQAFDLDGIFWAERTFITLEDGFRGGDRKFYFGVESVLRRHFGQVLNYLYNAPHRDHFHMDVGASVAFRSGSESTVKFLQAALVYILGKSVGSSGIDGRYGGSTKAAVNSALSDFSITGSISSSAVWKEFLKCLAQEAFGTSTLPRRSITISQPAPGQAFNINDNIHFTGTAESGVETIKIFANDFRLITKPVMGGSWSASYDQFNTGGARKISVKGFDSSERQVAEASVNVTLRSSFSSGYTPPETSANRLNNLVRALTNSSSQIMERFVDAKTMLELTASGFNGALYIDAGMSIFMDGSPHAPEIDPCWAFQETHLRYSDRVGQEQYVDSKEVPYLVLPLGYEDFGIELGDIAAVIYDDRIEYAVFAHTARASRLIGGSMALARSISSLNLSEDIVDIPEDVAYVIFPRSGDGTPQTPEAIRQRGRELFNELGGLLPEDEDPGAFSKYPAGATVPVGASQQNDIDIMARTIFGEARGESDQGKTSVGWVIMNRVAIAQSSGGYWWGNTIQDVCLKPYQFSCWNPNDPNRSLIENVQSDNLVFARCLDIAENVISSQISNPIGGATHYYASYIPAPFWVQGATFVIQIGVHRFYKNVP